MADLIGQIGEIFSKIILIGSGLVLRSIVILKSIKDLSALLNQGAPTIPSHLGLRQQWLN